MLHAIELARGAKHQPAAEIGVASTDPSQPCGKQSPFKPYMEFDGAPDGRIYRNWDPAPN